MGELRKREGGVAMIKDRDPEVERLDSFASMKKKKKGKIQELDKERGGEHVGLKSNERKRQRGVESRGIRKKTSPGYRVNIPERKVRRTGS